MTALAERLLERYYAGTVHPYRVFEERVRELIGSDTRVLLDAGCGRSAPVLRKFQGVVERLVGVELVAFADVPDDIETHNADLAALPLERESVD